MKTFGQLLKGFRVAKGLGLRATARRCGVTWSYLAKVEREEMEPPAERVIRALAKVLDFDFIPMMVAAGRVPARVERWLLEHPEELARLHRKSRPRRARRPARGQPAPE